jgi:methionyl-tRNA synthetase
VIAQATASQFTIAKESSIMFLNNVKRYLPEASIVVGRREMTKMSKNVDKCRRCKEWVIAEELSKHKCFDKLSTMLYDTDGTFSFDGKKWYRWFSATENSSPKSEHPKFTPDDSTEPKFYF